MQITINRLEMSVEAQNQFVTICVEAWLSSTGTISTICHVWSSTEVIPLMQSDMGYKTSSGCIVKD